MDMSIRMSTHTFVDMCVNMLEDTCDMFVDTCVEISVDMSV